ncbi:hypothetical protein VNI00_007284 [Paramarasmius palmivorus]|uniref:Uncharacterized protein n=1 Tax=Paramarasmius palmivorus TaxID=297713 RepID=A0AAW0D2I4_9AGAR
MELDIPGISSYPTSTRRALKSFGKNLQQSQTIRPNRLETHLRPKCPKPLTPCRCVLATVQLLAIKIRHQWIETDKKPRSLPCLGYALIPPLSVIPLSLGSPTDTQQPTERTYTLRSTPMHDTRGRDYVTPTAFQTVNNVERLGLLYVSDHRLPTVSLTFDIEAPEANVRLCEAKT